MEIVNCAVCRGKDWRDVAVLESGIWNVSDDELQRRELNLPVGGCSSCGHVQMTRPYTQDILDMLYFSDGRDINFFSDKVDPEQPYREMYDMFYSYVTDDSNIVDLGYGYGKLLRCIQSQLGQKKPNLVGVDFHQHDMPGVNCLQWNLNELESIDTAAWPGGMDVAICTHLLEHLSDPVGFVRYLVSQLKDDGVLFVEVPDFSGFFEQRWEPFANAYIAQHIHYYTPYTLSLLAEKAGAKAVEVRQVDTPGTRRLQMLIAKKTVASDASVLKEDFAVKVVQEKAQRIDGLRSELCRNIQNDIEQGSTVGLWGVGGESYLLFKKHPELIAELRQGHIVLFDLDFAGKFFHGVKITPSANIPDFEGPVYMTPLFYSTRDSMKRACRRWDKPIIDFYEPETLSLESA